MRISGRRQKKKVSPFLTGELKKPGPADKFKGSATPLPPSPYAGPLTSTVNPQPNESTKPIFQNAGRVITPNATTTTQPQATTTPYKYKVKGKGVQFLKDGTVKVAGQQLSKEEYQQYLALKGGTDSLSPHMAPNVLDVWSKELQDIQEEKSFNEEFQSSAQRSWEIETGRRKPEIDPALLEQIGQAPTEGFAPVPGLLSKENLQMTAAGVVPGMAAGAAAGAMAGGVNAIPGAVIGGIVTGVGTFLGKGGMSGKQQVTESKRRFDSSKQGQQEILNAVNSGQISTSDAINLWNKFQTEINRSRSELKQMSQENLQGWLAGGMDELIELEGYEELRDVYNQELRDALTNASTIKMASMQMGGI